MLDILLQIWKQYSVRDTAGGLFEIKERIDEKVQVSRSSPESPLSHKDPARETPGRNKYGFDNVVEGLRRFYSQDKWKDILPVFEDAVKSTLNSKITMSTKLEVRLSRLSYDYLRLHDTWAVVKETMDEADVLLEPGIKNEHNLISNKNGEVWCLSSAKFSDNSVHLAAAMCRGDSSEGPLLLSVWNGVEDVSLILPPAPSFVIEADGPNAFCRSFNKSFKEVFPLVFEVIPMFEMDPSKRMLHINPPFVENSK